MYWNNSNPQNAGNVDCLTTAGVDSDGAGVLYPICASRIPGEELDAKLHGKQSRTKLCGDESDPTLYGEQSGAKLGGDKSDPTLYGEQSGATLGGDKSDPTLNGEKSRAKLGGDESDTTLYGEQSRATRNSKQVSRSKAVDEELDTKLGVKESNFDIGDTVLVTGGSGFLGQHIIALLQTNTSHVARIKVLDLKPYNNLLGHAQPIPVDCTIGSVTDQDLVHGVMVGVDSVFHVAGLISYGTFPDVKAMEDINVQGTSNVIHGCLGAGVKRLIFCSTVDIVIGHDDVISGCEVTTKTPAQFLFPGYPGTKWKAEHLVLDADGNRGNNGVTLQTLSLRANVMYGEGDPYYVTTGLRNARRSGNVLYRIGDGSKVFQPAYVGNAAWAFICADKALSEGTCRSGQFFFIPDDTPVQNTFIFLEPFLQIRGCRLSSFHIPFKMVYYILLFSELVVKALSPLVKFQLPTESYSVKYINMHLCFTAAKAARELGYKPLFPPDVALQKSLEYYRLVEL